MAVQGLFIRILDYTGADILAELSEYIPDAGWSPDVFEGLTFESVNPGGFTIANFTIHRPIEQYWADLQYKNQVTIGRGPDVYWEGYIDKPTRSISPDTIDVQCLGWSARLNQLWTEDDITVDEAGSNNNLMSDFLVDVVLADSEIEIIAGDIDTNDFDYADGTRFEFAPSTYYFDAIEQMNAPNNYDWGVGNNRELYFQPKVNDLHWLVYLDDCSSLSIAPDTANLCTYVMVNYTEDSSHFQQVTAQDTDAQAKYGMIRKRLDLPGRIITAGAQEVADTYIAETSILKVAASFACNRVFDIYGAEHHLGEVRGGDNIRLVGWLATEGALYFVDNITTFQIKSAKYDNNAYALEVAPAEFLPSVELAIARLQAVGY